MSAVHINLIVGNDEYERNDEPAEVEEQPRPPIQEEDETLAASSAYKTTPVNMVESFIRRKRLNRAI